MAIVSDRKFSSPAINMNMRLGKPKQPKPAQPTRRKSATPEEIRQLRQAALNLNNAANCTDHNQYLLQLSEGFRIVRNLMRTANGV